MGKRVFMNSSSSGLFYKWENWGPPHDNEKWLSKVAELTQTPGCCSSAWFHLHNITPLPLAPAWSLQTSPPKIRLKWVFYLFLQWHEKSIQVKKTNVTLIHFHALPHHILPSSETADTATCTHPHPHTHPHKHGHLPWPTLPFSLC